MSEFDSHHHMHGDGDTVSGAIKSVFGDHHDVGSHLVNPHIRLDQDGHISHVAGHLSSNPDGHSDNNLWVPPADISHSSSFDTVMHHADPLMHYTDYQIPPLVF
jgi:hypothetical protein